MVSAAGALMISQAHAASRRAREANDAPTISGWPLTKASSGKPYVFQPTVVDTDGPRTQFRIRGKPAWAQFDTSTGRLSGQPTAADAGHYDDISITVSDGIAVDSLPPFAIDVTPSSTALINTPPSISGSPASVAAIGQLYAFAPVANDADNDALSFSIANVPAWAAFDPRSGKLYGTPGSDAAGVYADIGISVSDGKATVALAPFSISVAAPANVAPRISGTPPSSVTTGESYVFRPMASDADGDPLTFSIQNRPAWASFDPRTGSLTGAPSAVESGNYTGIVIAVSDGALTARLPAFDVTVMSQTLGSVSLSWDAPALNTDGTPVSNLKGYKVFYGLASRQYTSSLPLNDATLTSVTIEQLKSATWYFAVKAISSSGLESDFSQEVTKTVQ
jgi:hypothetical protein